MNRHHLAAHIVFADFALAIIGVTGAGPAYDFIGHHAARQFPIEKAFAGVSRPERAITIKDCQLGR
jgi:hypothetical protein